MIYCRSALCEYFINTSYSPVMAICFRKPDEYLIKPTWLMSKLCSNLVMKLEIRTNHRKLTKNLTAATDIEQLTVSSENNILSVKFTLAS